MPADGIFTAKLKVAEKAPTVAVTCAAPPTLPSVARADAFPLLSVTVRYIAESHGTGRYHLPIHGGAHDGVAACVSDVDHQSKGQLLSWVARLVVPLGDLHYRCRASRDNKLVAKR